MTDLLEAKKTLSGRLLQAGRAGGVVSARRSLTVAAAVAGAGRNVHAVGVGRKVTMDRTTSTRCVRIYVVEKLAKSLVPAGQRLPESIDGIPTDVIQAAPAFLAASPPACTAQRQQRQARPAGGASVGHPRVSAGTLACYCRSTRPGDPQGAVYALSNNHIFAAVNRASAGDVLLQPGPLDGGTAADAFATLERFVPLTLGGSVANRMDAALGRLTRAGFEQEVCAIGRLTGTAPATDGLAIRKHGRTTGYREGTVTDVSLDTLVGMDHQDASIVALFENQLRLEPRAPFVDVGLGGDSGSLVVTRRGRRAVALYFANPPGGEYGIASPIAEVLAALEVELL